MWLIAETITEECRMPFHLTCESCPELSEVIWHHLIADDMCLSINRTTTIVMHIDEDLHATLLSLIKDALYSIELLLVHRAVERSLQTFPLEWQTDKVHATAMPVVKLLCCWIEIVLIQLSLSLHLMMVELCTRKVNTVWQCFMT